MIKNLTPLAALFVTASALAFGRVGFDSPALFTDDAVVSGVQATQAQCSAEPNAVWAVAKNGVAECLRYWYGGFNQDGTAPRALFYFTGDILAENKVLDKNYSALSAGSMQASVKASAEFLGVPYVFVARPGIYGSSGEHKQRRRETEALLITAALDAIKKKHGIERVSLAGQSGGGHVVASLLNYRSDIDCAVASSAASSPKMRWQMVGASRDFTGYSDSYEPTEHLESVQKDARIFVVGDPQDSNVPWVTQLVLATKLKSRGVAVEVIEGQGSGSTHHGLSRTGTVIGSMCLKGSTGEEIRERVRNGLKG